MADYQFKYSPLTGRLTGNQMIEQTEQAINQLSSLVDSAAGQVEIISTLANEANENAATALETAEEALATTGRTYITVSTQTDANNYYDSQLIYIADSTSTNIPVADTGMLEVKTNDDKTACEQVFIADSSGDAYYRNGAITAETVGDVTTYTVTWGGWSSQPASQQYVQQELTNYAPLASLNDYLPLSGGTVSGDLTVTGNIAGSLVGNVTGLASGNLSITGGTMTGAIVSNGIVLKNKADDSYTEILAGTDENSSYISMYAKDYASSPGRINIRAYDGTNSKYLVLLPNGEFTWDSNTIMTHGVVNGHGIQSGRISCGSIPAGGNVTGTISFPAPFSGTPNVVCVQSSDASLLYHCVGDISSTGFRWRINSARTGNVTATIDWIAIY